MGSRGIDAIPLSTYRRRNQNLATVFSILALLVFFTYIFLGITSSNYSFATSVDLLTHLNDHRGVNGGIDPTVVKILAANVAIAAVAAILILVFTILGIRAFNKSKAVAQTEIRKRQTFQTSGYVAGQGYSAEPITAPVQSRTHANFNSASPLPPVVQASQVAPSLRAVSEQTNPAPSTYIAPDAPVEVVQERVMPAFELKLPEGMSVPEGFQSPENVVFRPTTPVESIPALAIEQPVDLSPAEELFAAIAEDIHDEEIAAHPELAQLEATQSVAPKTRKTRRDNFVEPDKGTLRLPSNGRLIAIFTSAGLVAGISAALALLATNRIVNEESDAYTPRVVENTLGLSPTFVGDLLQGMMNPQAVLMWLMVAIVVILGLQVFAMTSIASIMLKNSKRRLNALEAI
jgi:type IV secretory pathway VirB3-like protein